MQDFVLKIERLATRASLFAAGLAALVLLVLVVLTCIDVVGRYFFNAPLVGAVELVQICMGLIIFLTFPLMFLKNDHVMVDLIPQFGRGKLGWLVAVTSLVVIVVVALMLGDRVYDYAVRAMEDGDITQYLSIPRYPVVGLITLAIFSAALVAALRLLVLIVKPSSYEADETDVVNDQT